MEGSNAVIWRTSSYSGGNGGQCVEVADAANVVMVRDTKDRGGLVLSIHAGAWNAFLASLK
jgi:Domain of unknown function (DUF397)